MPHAPIADYTRLAVDTNRATGPSVSIGGSGKRSGRLSEKKFAHRALHAWTTVLLQTLRVFYLSRVTWGAP